MKIFENKNRIQKILIAIIMILLLNFSIPNYVHAGFGGMLMDPTIEFFTSIADAFQFLLEWTMNSELPTIFMAGPNTIPDKYKQDREGNVLTESDATIKIDGSQLTSLGSSIMEVLINPVGGIVDLVQDAINGSDFGIPIIKFSPEEIFANQVPLLDINFLNPSVKNEKGVVDEDNVAYALRNTIAAWYVAIRSIAIVGLLSVLLYIGIRILMTSIAADRAKYKSMLMDWVVALCLVLVLHYIMSFTLAICETITSFILNGKLSSVVVSISSSLFNGSIVYRTNFAGYTRMMIQSNNGFEKVAFFVLYIMFVTYSFRFAWIYLKRVLNMAFLTLMAPLVALTYPIDKISDGKAQAFNMWIKEYVFNALLQPFHLLLFFILISSAIDLATDHLIYAIVAFGFISSAEKLLRKMFGFEKASGGTVGTLSAATGGALLGNAFNMIAKAGKANGNGGGRPRDTDNVRLKDVGNEAKDEGVLDSLAAIQSGNEGDLNNSNNLRDADNNNNNILPDSNPMNIEVPEEQQEDWQYQQFLEDMQEEQEQPPEETYNDEYMRGAYNVQNDLDSLENESPTSDSQSSSSDHTVGQENEQESGQSMGINRQRLQEPNSDSNVDDLNSPLRQEEPEQKRKENRIQKALHSKPAKMMGNVAYHGVKFAAKAIPTGVAALTGLGVGIASTGDLSKAVSFAVASGAGTRGLLNKVDNVGMSKIEKAAGIDSVKSTYQTLRYGSEIEAKNAKFDKKFRESPELGRFVEYNYKNKDAKEKEKIKDDYLYFMQKTGKTDYEELKKMVKLENEFTRNEIINTVKMDKMIDKRAFINGKDSQAYANALKQVERYVGDTVKDKNGKEIKLDDNTKRNLAIRTLDSVQKLREA